MPDILPLSETDPHDFWMQQAIALAAQAGAADEVPVGAVIVSAENELIATGENRRQRDHDPTAHAEIIALRRAGQRLGTWYLTGCRLYVTLEPCPMCAAAIVQARIHTLIYGTTDPKAGAIDSVLQLPQSPAVFHRIQVISGVQAAACRQQLQTWFRQHRQRERQ
ncbi:MULTISPECIES: tRNA adenosine(34) deaminase TadA [unclassified Thermosynechococcus]|uniref:tRNA adenosine(34) deaminase TadA n=1 Tax=unclassified Thermosynechococcus TaxID=2622553 RepID=UPI00197E3484|nr:MULTISPECIES: tRNA adenosine(34) deaminase TadA [unclassified Thermosynechococcus]MDR7899138.1 tRNA adenosine(34) deaminase TadA [Thermosynechococcus sp. JY1332]MDR7906545.1 tRNA adenosine(34) deaminase TadA [Thermosynechococcus sp. JY1334]MDR7994367.1 tRNA adenosine(34) deaminase TadA [Thermosynechococcus sp. TG252]QSF49811.1 nucleoside deaminase [Thermosynechococcus sp. TA-1]WKT86258.1 tRNA adenosine(34) deaminase TadA [Thermosynechococcus sp. JY1339]